MKTSINLQAPRLFYIASLVFYITVSFLLGKNLSWDMVNYHVGLPHLFWTGSLQNHLMPVNVQSGINPTGYLPFYFMVLANWPSWLIIALLASFHALNSILIFQIAQRQFHSSGQSTELSIYAAIIGTFSAAQLQLIGTSFIDPVVSVLVLFGISILAARPQHFSYGSVLLAGLALGFASALKLPYSVFAVAALIFICGKADALKKILLFGFAGVVGAVIGGGYWHLQTYKLYGNPFFPFFNDIFRSPYFPFESLGVERFQSQSFVEFFLKPVEYVFPYSYTYIESLAPDIRFLALAGCVLLLMIFVTRAKLFPGFSLSHKSLVSEFSNHHFRLLVYLFVAYVLWQASSGNARYGLVILYLLGVALVILMARMSDISGLRVLVALVLCCQLFLYVVTKPDPRFGMSLDSWGGTIFGLEEKPDEKKYDGSLFVLESMLTPSFVFPYLGENSVFLSINGQYAPKPEGVYGDRVQHLIQEKKEKLRTIFWLSTTPALTVSSQDFKEYAGLVKARAVSNANFALEIWGLKVDEVTCSDYPAHGVEGHVVMICDLSRISPNRFNYAQTNERFEELENICPKLKPSGGFRPQKTQNRKFYMQQDIHVFITQKGQAYARQSRMIAPVFLADFENMNFDNPLHVEQVAKACKSIDSFKIDYRN